MKDLGSFGERVPSRIPSGCPHPCVGFFLPRLGYYFLRGVLFAPCSGGFRVLQAPKLSQVQLLPAWSRSRIPAVGFSSRADPPRVRACSVHLPRREQACRDPAVCIPTELRGLRSPGPFPVPFPAHAKSGSRKQRHLGAACTTLGLSSPSMRGFPAPCVCRGRGERDGAVPSSASSPRQMGRGVLPARRALKSCPQGHLPGG